ARSSGLSQLQHEGEESITFVQTRLRHPPLHEFVEDLSDRRSWLDPELRDEVVAVDRETGPIEGDLRLELGRDPRSKLVQPTGLRRHTAAFVVRLAEGEEVVDGCRTDLREKPTDRRIRPARIVREHVVPNESFNALDRLPRDVPAPKDRVRPIRAGHLVTVEVTVGRGLRLADVVKQRREADDTASFGRGSGIHRTDSVIPQVLARKLVLAD